jgi:hypothetical protein
VGTVVGAAVVAVPLLASVGLGGWLLYGSNVVRLEPWLRSSVPLLSSAFALGVLLFVWRAMWQARVDALEKARRQSTVVKATRDRLRVETAGPFGPASHDLPTPRVRAVQVRREASRVITVASPDAVPCVVVMLDDGVEVRLLPGRDEVELQWVVRAVGRVMGLGDTESVERSRD